MSNVAVLYGGKSGEHEVSLHSASYVVRQLTGRHTLVLVGVNRDGRWYVQDSVGNSIPERLNIVADAGRQVSVVPGEGFRQGGQRLNVDVVVPVLHGVNGEDGTVQGLLEVAGVPYTGCGVLASALGMDKDLSKRVWVQAGLDVVPWIVARASDSGERLRTLSRQAVEELGQDVFVKPACSGSSVGVSRVRAESGYPARTAESETGELAGQIVRAIQAALEHDRKVLVEQAVVGREIECSVVSAEGVRSFDPGEVVLGGGHDFYTYTAKYQDAGAADIVVRATMDEKLRLRIRDMAERAFRAVGGRGFARVDFLTDGDQVFVNEINTLPGMTSISLFPAMVEHGGVKVADLLDKLIAAAVEGSG